MSRITTLIATLLTIVTLSAVCAAAADQEAEYRTPLAGEAFTLGLGSVTIEVPARDRSTQSALTLGVSSFFPALGSTDALPMAAFYDRRYRPDYTTRLVFSVFANEFDLAVPLSPRTELLLHIHNDTSPFAEETLVAGRPVRETAMIRGEAGGWLGVGWRQAVAPFQPDNSARLQLWYQGGFQYSGRTADTGNSVKLPPDTDQHGIRLRIRYDSLRRNLMELPHAGLAAGGDLEWNRRSHWSDASYGGSTFKDSGTRDYQKISGYLLAALPVPGMSERNRLLASVYGGTAPNHDLDRFSAFRIGVGPFPSESDDLWRCPYPGATYNQFEAADYVISTLEYRRELLPFFYLHLRGTLAWVNRQITANSSIRFSEDRGEAFSAGITSGLPWNSSLYVEYSHDSGILRNGSPGDGMMLLWSKSF